MTRRSQWSKCGCMKYAVVASVAASSPMIVWTVKPRARAASTARSADRIVGPQTAVSSWAVTMSVRSVLIRRSFLGRSSSRSRLGDLLGVAAWCSFAEQPIAQRLGPATCPRRDRPAPRGSPSHRPRGPRSRAPASSPRRPAPLRCRRRGSPTIGHAGHRHLEQQTGDTVPAGRVEPHVGVGQVELGEVGVPPLQPDVLGRRPADRGRGSAPSRPTSGSRRPASGARPRARCRCASAGPSGRPRTPAAAATGPPPAGEPAGCPDPPGRGGRESVLLTHRRADACPAASSPGSHCR